MRAALDRVVGFDPGLTQLRNALRAVLAIGLALAAEYCFVRATGAMQSDTPNPGQHHAVLVVALLLGALTAWISSFSVTDATARAQLVSTLLFPVLLFAAMSVGLLVGSHRLLSLTFLVIAVTLAIWLRRFGPRGRGGGLAVFQGGFMGYFLHPEIPIGNAGWVAAEIAIGGLIALLVRFVLVRPHNGKTLVRMQRAWVARSRRLLDLAERLLATAPGEHEYGRTLGKLHRQEVRLNEATLMIDAQLAEPGATSAARLLHGRLYDLELAVSNVARFTEALSRRPLSPQVRELVRRTLAAVREGDHAAASDLLIGCLAEVAPAGANDDDPDRTTGVLLRRLAGSVRTAVSAERHWLALGEIGEDRAADGNFVPALTLAGGYLPGSAPVSARASTTPDRDSRLNRAALAPEVRSAIQVAIAASVTIALADMVNGRRFYWGLLAVFLAFIATTNSAEQARKAMFRAGGTAVGIVIGDVGVHLAGDNTVVIFAVVLVSLFVGSYLIRVNYMFMVIGITVTMSQLYSQLGEFSWHLLLLRLLETAIGAAVVTVVVLTVLPLRPHRVLRAGALTYFEELQTLVNRALAAVTDTGPSSGELSLIRADVRRLDAAYHALIMTARPLRSGIIGNNSSQLRKVLAIATASRYYARNLAVGIQSWPSNGLPAATLNAARGELSGSMESIRQRIAAGPNATFGRAGIYTRTSSLFDAVDRRLDRFDEHTVMGDFMMLDAAMARLALALDMEVRDHDTTASAQLVAS
jgi:uncharacterized membrane protein YccC